MSDDQKNKKNKTQTTLNFRMKWSTRWKDSLKTQLWILIATSIPFIGPTVLYLLLEDTFYGSYDELKKPAWAAPTTLILDIAMSVAYSCFGYASYRVWLVGGKISVKTFLPFLIYLVTMLVNWAEDFFGPTQLCSLTIVFVVTLFLGLITTVFFFKIDCLAALYCVPYLGWLVYEVFLTYFLWKLNADGEWFANREILNENPNIDLVE